MSLKAPQGEARTIDERNEGMTERAIEIEELREAGSDGGDLMGYYCRGHIDHYKFAEAANHYSGAYPGHDDRYVKSEKASHRWWRCVPMSGDPGQIMFHPAKPRERGAFPVTVCECVIERRVAVTGREVDESRRQRDVGFYEGLNWALRELDGINPDASNKLLSRWRANTPNTPTST